MKRNKGITLIALIITIIVLLILAGVTLSMVLGENGIIGKAQLAKEKTNESQNDEKIKINDLENQIDRTIYRNNNKITRVEIAKEVTFDEENSKEFNIKDIYSNYIELSNENFAYYGEYYTSTTAGRTKTYYPLKLEYDNNTGILIVTDINRYIQYGTLICYASNVSIYLYY